MQLGPKTDAALNQWLSGSTWFKDHPSDLGRWYDVVDTYAREHGTELVDRELIDEIEFRIVSRGGKVNDYLEPVIRDRVSAALHILGFLERTGR